MDSVLRGLVDEFWAADIHSQTTDGDEDDWKKKLQQELERMNKRVEESAEATRQIVTSEVNSLHHKIDALSAKVTQLGVGTYLASNVIHSKVIELGGANLVQTAVEGVATRGAVYLASDAAQRAIVNKVADEASVTRQMVTTEANSASDAIRGSLADEASVTRQMVTTEANSASDAIRGSLADEASVTRQMVTTEANGTRAKVTEMGGANLVQTALEGAATRYNTDAQGMMARGTAALTSRAVIHAITTDGALTRDKVEDESEVTRYVETTEAAITHNDMADEAVLTRGIISAEGNTIGRTVVQQGNSTRVMNQADGQLTRAIVGIEGSSASRNITTAIRVVRSEAEETRNHVTDEADTTRYVSTSDINQLSRRLGDVSRDVVTVNKNIVAVNGKVKNLGDKVCALEDRVGELANEAADTTDNVDAINDAMVAMQSIVDDMPLHVGRIGLRVHNLSNAVDALASLPEHVKQLAKSMGVVGGALDRNTEATADMGGQVWGLSAANYELTSEVNDMGISLENRFEQVGDDLWEKIDGMEASQFPANPNESQPPATTGSGAPQPSATTELSGGNVALDMIAHPHPPRPVQHASSVLSAKPIMRTGSKSLIPVTPGFSFFGSDKHGEKRPGGNLSTGASPTKKQRTSTSVAEGSSSGGLANKQAVLYGKNLPSPLALTDSPAGGSAVIPVLEGSVGLVGGDPDLSGGDASPTRDDGAVVDDHEGALLGDDDGKTGPGVKSPRKGQIAAIVPKIAPGSTYALSNITVPTEFDIGPRKENKKNTSKLDLIPVAEFPAYWKGKIQKEDGPKKGHRQLSVVTNSKEPTLCWGSYILKMKPTAPWVNKNVECPACAERRIKAKSSSSKMSSAPFCFYFIDLEKVLALPAASAAAPSGPAGAPPGALAGPAGTTSGAQPGASAAASTGPAGAPPGAPAGPAGTTAGAPPGLSATASAGTVGQSSGLPSEPSESAE